MERSGEITIYNLPLNPEDIPSGITRLSFIHELNRPINPGDIPATITHLTVNSEILQIGSIPRSVTNLTFGHEFTGNIDPDIIPETVTNIKFDNYIEDHINLRRVLRNITRFTTSGNFKAEHIRELPDGLKFLYIRSYPDPDELFENLERFLNKEDFTLVMPRNNVTLLKKLSDNLDNIRAKVLCEFEIQVPFSNEMETIILEIDDPRIISYIESVEREESEYDSELENDNNERELEDDNYINSDVENDNNEEEAEEDFDPYENDEELSEDELTRIQAETNAEMREINERNRRLASEMVIEPEQETRADGYPDIPDDESDMLRTKCNNESGLQGDLTYKSGVQAILSITRDDKYVAYCYNYGELKSAFDNNKSGYRDSISNRDMTIYKEPYLGVWVDREGYENSETYNTLVLVEVSRVRKFGMQDIILYTLKPVNFSAFKNREKITRNDIENFVAEERDLLPRNSHLEEKENIRLVTLNPMNIKDIINPSVVVQLEAVRQNGWAIQFIKDPSEEVQLEAVRQNGYAIRFIKDPSEEMKLEAVRQNGYAIQFIKDPSETVQLEAVRSNGYAIRFIKDPSEEMKLEAVRQNGYAIQYIKDPSETVQLEAVRQDGRAFRYIKDPSEEMKLEAVRQNGLAIRYIEDPSEEVQISAILNTRDAIQFISNPTPRVEAMTRS
jgi:hypothetical protein